MYRIMVWVDALAYQRKDAPHIDRKYQCARLVARINEALTAAGYYVRIDYREKY